MPINVKNTGCVPILMYVIKNKNFADAYHTFNSTK